MAELFDARDPGLRFVSAFGFVVLCAAILTTGARFAAAAEVEVNLDVLKTVPAARSDAPAEAIKLIPPKAKRQNVGRREEALRRARKRRLIEEAKRKAAAKRAAAKKQAAQRRKAEEARKAKEAKQAAEMGRRAEAEREAEAARRAEAEKRKAEADEKAKAEAAKAAQAATAAEAAEAAKAAESGKTEAVTPKPAKKAAATAPPTKSGKPKAASADAKKQIATRTARVPLSRARLLFGKESAALSRDAKGKLEPIAAKMISEEKALLVIYAYAAGDGSNASEARRLSLSRALAVRRMIIGRGIPATRTEIRALGDRVETGPSDRVDLVLVQR